MDHILAVCRERGAPYGIEFGELERLSNSRSALEAAEFARDMGAYDPFHRGTFEAYFTHGRNIGDRSVLCDVAAQVGLDAAALESALDEGRYAKRVEEGSREARRLGVTAVPSFFIEDLPVITGAVGEARFREALQSVAEGQVSSWPG